MAPPPADGTDGQPAAGREILSKSWTLRGFFCSEFAEQPYAEFLREVGAGIADGRIRYREDIVDGLDKALEVFIGMADGGNFAKVIVRVGMLPDDV
jgi:NADPH-dependent curcumin reductase CurA